MSIRTTGVSSSPYSLNAGGAAKSLQEKFYISSITLAPATGTPTTTVVSGATVAYQYIYNYSHDIRGLGNRE